MKTLYVSDLDGTLIRSNEQSSDFTNDTINSLVASGVLFSYATARSYHTARKVAGGIKAQIPLVVYNGTMIVDNSDGSFLYKNFFGEEVHELIDDFISCGVYPVIYSLIENVEKYSFVVGKCMRETEEFLNSRQGDIRENPIHNPADLHKGEIFYVMCIGDEEKLSSLNDKYKDTHHCIFQKDIYSGDRWLEILPKEATKANAIKELKKMLDCDKLVVFGDGINDMEMFLLADEAYAMENAAPELKAVATAVIGNNNDDAVAKWLIENCDR